MASIYPELAMVAQDLITQFGRQVSYQRQGTIDRVPGQPWRGQVPVDPIIVTAAVFDATSYDRSASPEIQFTKTALIAARTLAFEPLADDFMIDRERDLDIRYRVVRVNTLRPGTVGLLYTLSLSTAKS